MMINKILRCLCAVVCRAGRVCPIVVVPKVRATQAMFAAGSVPDIPAEWVRAEELMRNQRSQKPSKSAQLKRSAGQPRRKSSSLSELAQVVHKTAPPQVRLKCKLNFILSYGQFSGIVGCACCIDGRVGTSESGHFGAGPDDSVGVRFHNLAFRCSLAKFRDLRIVLESLQMDMEVSRQGK